MYLRNWGSWCRGHTCNPSTWEGEAGGPDQDQPELQRLWGQPGLHGTLSQKGRGMRRRRARGRKGGRKEKEEMGRRERGREGGREGTGVYQCELCPFLNSQPHQKERDFS